MKRIVTLLMASLLVAFMFSCASKPDEEKNAANIPEKADEISENSTLSDAVDETESRPVSETSVAPLDFKVSEIKQGDVILGQAVTDYSYTDEQNFSFRLAGELVLTGDLSYAENSALTFTPTEQFRNKANLHCNGIEKPLYMWTEMRNEKTFLDAISDEQKAQAERMEMPEVTLKISNYEVIATGYHIAAYADFIEIIEE